MGGGDGLLGIWGWGSQGGDGGGGEGAEGVMESREWGGVSEMGGRRGRG